MIPRPTVTPTHGRRVTQRAQRAQPVGPVGAGTPASARRRSRRLGRATRVPNFEISAGSTVSDASMTSSTASADDTATP